MAIRYIVLDVNGYQIGNSHKSKVDAELKLAKLKAKGLWTINRKSRIKKVNK